MPSDSKKKRDAKKKEAAKARASGQPAGSTNKTANGKTSPDQSKVIETNGDCVDKLTAMLEEDLEIASQNRACTGVLGIEPTSRDIKIENLSITFHGAEILNETNLELNYGRRYGLIGPNGCGKSTLLSVISRREIPIQDSIDIYHLIKEVPPLEKSALDAVLDVEKERIKLEKLAEDLALKEDDESQQQLIDIYERLDDMGADRSRARAGYILHGLGFDKEMQQRPCKSFSGGWRMRVALARCLLTRPHLLLLDGPTAHLDLESCIWLEEELKNYRGILCMVSHSQDFLNGVCTNIIHMDKGRLNYYGGNYDQFVKTRAELLVNQQKRYEWEQAQIAHMKEYVNRFGAGTRAKQAQSKEKVMAKMIDAGLAEKVTVDKSLEFYFPSCGKIPPPVLMVQNISFRYNENSRWIYKDLELGIDLDSRIVLVGPNGCGKSTFLKLLCGDVMPTDGLIRRHSHLRIARYHQHLAEELDLSISALDYMMQKFPEVTERDYMRRRLGMYGLSGAHQVCPMRHLSDGQRCRVSFAWVAFTSPHLLLLDEPSNALDISTIDSLANAINEFDGGVIIVSHDFRLISQVAKEIWVCEDSTIKKWGGSIIDYKQKLKSKIVKESDFNH